MKRFALHLPALLVLWITGAHFLRGGDVWLTAVWAASPLLFFLRHGWVRRAAQAALAFSMVLFLDLGMRLVNMRMMLGEPWLRLAVIMGAVALVAAIAAILFETTSLRERYEDGRPALAPAGAFLLATTLLTVSRAKVSDFPILLPDRFMPGSGWLLIFALGIYAALVTRALLNPGLKPRQWSRWRLRLWGLFSIIFFAQLALGLAGIERFLMTGQLHLPVPALIMAGPIYRGEGFFMPILFLSTVAFVGPAWCSWLCYVGAWDGAMSANKKTAVPLPKWRQPLRLAIVLLVGAAAWGLRTAGVSTPVAALLAALFGIAGVGVMVFISRRTGAMVHCTTFCPIGVFSNVLGKLNPFRIRVGKGCTGCGVCERVCRYDALDADRIAAGKPGLSCTLCGDCVSGCPHAALGYRFPGLSARSARALYTALVIGAHAAFLGIARI